MKTNLILTFTSPDRPGIVEDLTRIVVAHGGNWEESRLARLCGDFAGIARVEIGDAQVSKLCSDLEQLADKGLAVHWKTTTETISGPHPSARLTCSGADHEGIVSAIAAHLSSAGVNVEERQTSVEPAPITGTPLFRLDCRLGIPSACDQAALAEDLQRLENDLGVEIQLHTD